MKAVLEDAEKKKEETERLSINLAKYLPPQVHEAIFSGKFDTEIKTKRKKLTIFFSDIANFTSTSEGLQPEDLTKYLNEYFSEMTAIALKYGATIDKYIGDAMMLFFGDPDTKGEREDARACFGSEFRTPGHIPVCRESPGGLSVRQGHTELAVAIARLAGLLPCTIGAEMLEPEGDNALSVNSAKEYSRINNIPMITGEDILETIFEN